GLVLEDRLEHALRELGLVRRVRRQEHAALEYRLDDRGNVMVVDHAAEERDLVEDVLPRQLLEVAGQVGLGKRSRNLELAPESHPLGDVPEELVDRVDADRREHLLAVRRSQREVAHDSAMSVRYAPASSRPSRSDG